jgi:hypothetical protein
MYQAFSGFAMEIIHRFFGVFSCSPFLHPLTYRRSVLISEKIPRFSDFFLFSVLYARTFVFVILPKLFCSLNIFSRPHFQSCTKNESHRVFPFIFNRHRRHLTAKQTRKPPPQAGGRLPSMISYRFSSGSNGCTL